MTNTKGMETTKQTSVDWLIEELGEYFPWGIGGIEYMIKQAKEMHKKEIKDAIFWGNIKGYDEHKRTCIHDEDEQYYEQRYGGKK
jgi:hypothetical protein